MGSYLYHIYIITYILFSQQLIYPDFIATGSASKLQGDGVLIPSHAADWSLLCD